ncbi:MAG: rRNA (cytosine967-C5)-methyltransferase [Desulfonauticus sp.]|nr:MAG: Fmu (Sun) domain protein [Desulfonauticus sp. 38_4375]MDK2922198.1 rRNA (cytosine967-C5)-methyltransferase [Desulfonauticus sp.]
MLSLKKEVRFKAIQVIKSTLKGEDLQAALDNTLSQLLDTRDKALLTELSYGYFRYKNQLEFIWQRFIKKSAHLPLEINILLSTAVYQLLYLSKIPAYAVISWSVEFSKQNYGEKLAGLVNAVLRKISQLSLEEDFFKQDKADTLTFLSRKYAAPTWLVRYLLKDLGEEKALKFLASSLSRPLSSVLLAKNCDLSALREAIEENTEVGFSIKKGREEEVFRFLEAKKCLFYNQSIESQKILLSLLEEKDHLVWDACAGSGGKSFILSRVNKKVIASDINWKRLCFLKKESKRLGFTLMGVLRASAYALPCAQVEGILLDVPCSGLGVIARRPDIKWKRKEEDILNLAKIQKKILSKVASRVKKGGKIYYLTCTLTRKENELQIAEFLTAYPQFSLEKQILPDCSRQEVFFGACLHRK